MDALSPSNMYPMSSEEGEGSALAVGKANREAQSDYDEYVASRLAVKQIHEDEEDFLRGGGTQNLEGCLGVACLHVLCVLFVVNKVKCLPFVCFCVRILFP